MFNISDIYSFEGKLCNVSFIIIISYSSYYYYYEEITGDYNIAIATVHMHNQDSTDIVTGIASYSYVYMITLD